MLRKLRAAALFALALAPSACLAWRWRSMPHLGLYQDDALYLVGARSLAEGHGYRIESLPSAPFQTKYPPLVSLLFAPLWKFGPVFPENLKLATLVAWLMLPPFLVVARALFRHFGLGTVEAWALTFAAAWHPVVCLLSTAVMSDLLFLTPFLGAVFLAEKALDSRERPWLAAAAGVMAGVASLARTVALPLLVTVTLCFFWRRQFQRAGLFLAGMLPAVLGWLAWTSAHTFSTQDPALLFYTSYLGMERLIVRPDNLLVVVWHNVEVFLRVLSKLLVFDAATGVNVHIERLLGAAALAGMVRLVKRSGRIQYPVAAAGITVLLLVHHYTPDERLALPIYPLVLMGFWTEAKNLWRALQAAWRSRRAADRAVAAAAAVVLAALAVFMVACQLMGLVRAMPTLYDACRRDLETYQPAYAWIRTHTSPEATFYAYDDPVLYLHTGRRALGLTLFPGRAYSGNMKQTEDEFIRAVPRRACDRRLDYLLVTSVDFYRGGRTGLLFETAARDPRLTKEYESGPAAVYRCPQ